MQITEINTEILKQHALTLYKIKHTLFKDYCGKVEYLKIYKETGIYPALYEEVLQLNKIIESLDYNIKNHTKDDGIGEQTKC